MQQREGVCNNSFAGCYKVYKNMAILKFENTFYTDARYASVEEIDVCKKAALHEILSKVLNDPISGPDIKSGRALIISKWTAEDEIQTDSLDPTHKVWKSVKHSLRMEVFTGEDLDSILLDLDYQKAPRENRFML